MLLVLALFGCWTSERREITEEAAVIREMSDHWTDAAAARDAVVQGDLAAANRAGGKLAAGLPIEALPAELSAYQDELATATKRVQAATNLADAGVGVGKMAQACGRCHNAAGAVLDVPDPVPPEQIDGIKGEMAVHAWAAEKLWLGMIRPSDADLRDAVAVISSPGLVHDDPKVSQAAAELDAGVHELAAAVQEDVSARGERYGQLLTTCATCHLLRPGDIGAEPTGP